MLLTGEGSARCEEGCTGADCDTCATAGDGVCDDGSLGGLRRCAVGTDTADCACATLVPLSVRVLPADVAPSAAPLGAYGGAVELTFGPDSWSTPQRVALRASVDDDTAWHGVVHAGQAVTYSIQPTVEADARFSERGVLPRFGVVDNDLPGLAIHTISTSALHTREGVGQLQVHAAASACVEMATEAACLATDDCQWEADAEFPCFLPDEAKMAVLLSIIAADGDGLTDQYLVGPLATEPVGPPLRILITGPAAGGLAIFPAELEFNSSNWRTAQTVAVQAVDNPVVDGPRQLVIAHAIQANECVAANPTDGDNVGRCRAAAMTSDDAASQAACEAQGPDCLYRAEWAYMDHARCLDESVSLSMPVAVDDDDRAGIFTDVVTRVAAASACPRSAAVVAAGTGEALRTCRAYNTVDRCCTAEHTELIGADRAARFSGVSLECSLYIDYVLCDSACSASQSSWADYGDSGDNSTIYVCQSLCERLAAVCPGNTCQALLGRSSGGAFANVIVRPAVSVLHLAENSYLAYSHERNCFGGGVFLSESTVPSAADMHAHLSSKPTDTVQLSSVAGSAPMDNDGTSNDGVISVAGTIAFGPENQYPSSDDAVPYFSHAAVAVTAIDNAEDNGAFALSAIVQTTTSDDSRFNDQWTVDVVVFNDDFAGLVVRTNGTVVCTASSCDPVLTLDEIGSGAGSQGEYTIELAARPTADVHITLRRPTGRRALGVSPATATFTAADWDVPQTVTVTALTDEYPEGVHTVSIGHTVSSSDVAYSSLVADDVIVTITDYSILTNATELFVNEGSFDGLQVSLGTLPDALAAASERAMIVKLYGGGQDDGMPQLTVRPDVLVFKPHEYALAQRVFVVGAAEDSIDYGHIRRRLSLVLSRAPGQCQVVTGAQENTGFGELHHLAQHSADCDGIDRGVLRSWRLRVDGSQGAIDRTCCALAEPFDVCEELETVLADDTSMAALAQLNVDCDPSRIMQKWQLVLDASTDPNGMKVRYTCCRPTAAMTQGSCTQRSTTETDSFLYLDLGGYATAQATADAISSLSGTDEDGCKLACTADLSCESFAWDPSSGACHLHAAVLPADAPLEDSSSSSLISYYRNFGSSNLNEHAVEACAADELLSQWRLTYPASERLAMSFTCCAWSVTGSRSMHRVLPANLLSNDKAGVVVSPLAFGASAAELTFEEGGNAFPFQLSLSSKPLAPVSITLQIPAGMRAAATPSAMTFDALTWNTPQQFVMRADENDQHDGDRDLFVVVEAASSDHVYGRSTVTTAPSAEWCLGEGTVCNVWGPLAPVCAGDGITYQHECAARVGCEDLLYVGECDGRPLDLMTGGLAVVTFTILDDDASGIEFLLATSLASCDALSPAAFEECGGSCVPSGECVRQLRGSEDGQSDLAVVKLTSSPRGTVTVALENEFDDHQIKFSPRDTAVISYDDPSWVASLELVFDPTNWNTPQTVHIGCVDDAVDELQTHTAKLFVLSSSVSDHGYNQARRHVADVTIIDNDVALVSVYAPFAGVSVLEGTQSSYKLWLETKPTQDVIVAVSGTQVDVAVGDDTPSATADVVFTADSWSVPQEVVIQATDDFDIERTTSRNAAGEDGEHNPRQHTGTIHHVVSSSDPFYDSGARGESCNLPTGLPVFVNILDNDEPRAFLTETEIALAEGDPAAQYIFKLLARPTKDVFFDVVYDPRVLRVQPTVLTFAAAGWDSETQAVVRVWAVDDNLEQTDTNDAIDGIQATTLIHHRIRTEDPFYSSPEERHLIEPPPLPVTVTDNDFSAVLIDSSENDVIVRENGMLGHYNVRLATQPHKDVFLHVYPGSLSEAIASDHEVYVVNSSVLMFTADNWNATQTVLVAAVDDMEEEDMCSLPTGPAGPKLPQLVRHLMITEDEKYLPGCGPQKHDCTMRGVQFATQSGCEAACRAPHDPLDNTAPSEKWCGGCLRVYAPSTGDLAAGCPHALNGTVMPLPLCYKFEPRQGIYYAGDHFPARDSADETEAEEFSELMLRRTVGDYTTRWSAVSVYVIDDDSSLLTAAERVSDISERTTVHSWRSIRNVTVYAGVPSELTIYASDRCSKVPTAQTAQYEALFRLSTSDGHEAPRIAYNTQPSQYAVDVLVGPSPFVRAHVALLVGSGNNRFEAPIYGSPIYLRVLPGYVHYLHSYVVGLDPISTVETASLRIFWFDKFGSPTNLACRPLRRHTVPLGDISHSDCRVGEGMHTSMFEIGFLDMAGNTVPPATFAKTQFGWCDARSREYGYSEAQCLEDQAGGSSTVVEYTSETPGDFLVHISIDGTPIAGSPPGRIWAPSPYPIVVAPGPTDITQCYAEGTGASNARAGDETVFLIKLADRFGNVKSPLTSDPVSFECVMAFQSTPPIGPVHGVVSPQDDGYICVYTVEKAGAYLISVKAAPVTGASTVKQHISTSPMALDVKPAYPDPNYFLVKAGDGSELVDPVYAVGELVQFQVLARDRFHNPSTKLCDATNCVSTPLPTVARTTLVHGVEVADSVTVSAPMVDVGIYPVEFTPIFAGECRIEVVVGGQHVPQSPFQITVESTQLEPSMSLVEGGGIEGGVAGFSSTFQVRLRDRHGNPVAGEDHDATLQAGVLQSNTHCFNVTNETAIPLPTELGVQDINCSSLNARIKVPVGCSESWTNSTPACAIPVDCVGRFSTWTSCSDFENADNPSTCGFGTRRRHYIIEREARNGGYECDYGNNYLWEEPCAMNPCQPVTACVDDLGHSQIVADTSESACELTGNTWSPGQADPACTAVHLEECEQISSQQDCDAGDGTSFCTWDGAACTATDATACSDLSLDGESACLDAPDIECTFIEDGSCTTPQGDAVPDASSRNSCERNGNIWICTAHCEAECSRTGPGLTGQPNEPAVDMQCLIFFGWQVLPPALPPNSTNTTGPTCTATFAADCADATNAADCAAASSALGGGACAWKSDGSCRAADAVACRTALHNIASKNTFYPEFGVGEYYCEAAGECSYNAGTANVTLTVLPYRQMWCQYCYEVTDSSPVTATALSDGSVHEFQYQVNTPGTWEVVIVMRLPVGQSQQEEEVFHFRKIATVLARSDAAADATMSTIEDLMTSFVNQTFTFHLQARTSQGINLVEGGDPFEVQFGELVLDATNDEDVLVVNSTQAVRASFEDSGDGVYSVTVWTIIAGTYDVVPRLNNGGGVEMTTYTVNVLPGLTDPQHSIVTRRSVRYAGQEMFIEIKARDIFSNDQVYSPFKGPDPFEVVADGPGPVAVQLDNFNNGIYRARWVATLSGLYTLNISLHSVQISGSPVQVDMGSAPVSGATSTAAGIGLGLSGELDADTPTSFSVQLRDAFGNRGTLVRELMRVAFIGSPRELYPISTPLASDPPTRDDKNQLTLELLSLPVALLDCDSLALRGDNGSAINATAFGVLGGFLLNDWGEWSPMHLEEQEDGGRGAHLLFPLATVHGLRLVFSNSSTTNQDSSRALPTGIHPTNGLVFSCAKPVNVSLIPDEGGSHELRYHATIAGSYHLRINYGHELITERQYLVHVRPGRFNESTSSSSMAYFATNATEVESIDENTVISPAWPTTMAGRVTGFSVVVRDSYSNELAGGEGLLAATLQLKRPRTILNMRVHSVAGHYFFGALPTRIGIYVLEVSRMGAAMPNMRSIVVVLPAEPYGPSCHLQRHGGALLDDPISGLVNWHPSNYPVLASPHSFHLDVVLVDQFGNAIDVDFGSTGCQVQVTVSSDEPHIIAKGAQSLTDSSRGQLIHATDGNPVEVRLSTFVAGRYTLNIELVSPDNTSLPVGGSPWQMQARAKQCVGSWSEFTVQRETDFVAGQLFEIGLTVTDAFANPCTPEHLEVSVETTVSLQTKAAQRLETPTETASRELREEQIINTALQTGFISSIADAPKLFMEAGRIQWLGSSFQFRSPGYYVYTDIPTVVGQYGFEIKVNNATLWLHVSGRGKTPFELGAAASTNGRLDSLEQIQTLLNLVAVTVRPGPASPSRSFISGMAGTEVDVPTRFFVRTLDAYDNSVGGLFSTVCTKIVRVDAPVPSSAPESIHLSAAPVFATTVYAGAGNIFNVTMNTTVSGIYQTQVFVFDGGPANIGYYRDCMSLLAAEEEDKYALKPKLASSCPQYNFAQLSENGLCTSSLAYASDDAAFAVVDTNGDGVLSRLEVRADQAARLRGGALVLLVGTDRAAPTYENDLMAALDRNADAVIDREEFNLRWAERMELPELQVLPGAATVMTSTAFGNGLRGGFRGDPLKFKVELRDRFGNLRSYAVCDVLEIFVINVNATAQAGVFRRGYDLAEELPAALRALVSRTPGLELNGCEIGNCVSTLAKFDYGMFNGTAGGPGAQFTQTARTFRQFDSGIYIVSYTPQSPDVYHMCVFVNGVRLPVERCDFGCTPAVVMLNDELRVPSLLSVTDAKDEVVRAGTTLQFVVQLRNEINYDLNFGGYTGSLVVGMHPDVTKCVATADLVDCDEDWLVPIPFEFSFRDRMDGSYLIQYIPTAPGHYNLSVMVNLTHASLPVIPCERGLLSCITRFDPVCGYDLRTYPNECFAQNECIELAYEGVCDYMRPIPIPWIEQPLAEFSVVVLPSGTSPEHSVVSVKEAYMCPLGTCYRLKTLRKTAASPPRHVGLSTRRSFCDTRDNNLAMHRCPGQTFEFRVQALDSFGNIPEYRPREEIFAGSCVGPVAVPFSSRNTGANGTYFYTAQLTVSGDYVISLTMNGEDVGASSFWLAVDPPHYWVMETSSVVSYTPRVVAGSSGSLFLRPRGEYGNALYSEPAPGPLADGSVMLNFNPPTEHTKAVSSWDRVNGTLQVTYTVRAAGVYKINVSFFAMPFADDTIDLIVVPSRAVASQCVAYGVGLQDGIAGQTDRAVYIEAKDMFGNSATEPVGIERFVVAIQHRGDSSATRQIGLPSGFTPVHTGASYTATLAAYTPPVYTYVYTALPAGAYASTVVLGESLDSTVGYAEVLVPYRQDVVRSNGFNLLLRLASPPIIARLQFRDTGAQIELEFDRPTNKGRQPQPASCSALIGDDDVARLGTDDTATCRWQSWTTILITLGPGATVLVGDSIYVKPDVIVSYDENSFASSDGDVLATPANIPVPVVTLAAPNVLGSCDDLLLDASGSVGSGGRAMGYTYTALAGVGANLAAVYDILHEQSCRPLAETPCNQAVVSSETLVSGKTYTFRVAVTNFWGATSTATAVVTKSSRPTPTVLISGPTTQHVRRSDTVVIRSDVELSSCYNGDAAMEFGWVQLPGSPGIELPAQFVNSREIQLAKGTLQAGQAYRFQFRGVVEGLAASAEVAIDVSYSGMDVEIKGGSRTVPASLDPMVLSVLIADPEDPNIEHLVSYEWGCEPVGHPGEACVSGSSATTQTFWNRLGEANEQLTMPARVLPVGAYRFTVTIRKDPGFRSQSSSAVVTLVADPILDVLIERKLPVGATESTFSTTDRLILRYQVSGKAPGMVESCTWSVDETLDLDAEGVLGTTRRSKELVVRPGHLTESFYTFTVSCTETPIAGNAEATVLATGSAQYTVRVNRPPSSGTLRLKDSGMHEDALSMDLIDASGAVAELEISAENWVDDSAHLPLSYEFRTSHPDSPEREVLLARGPTPTVVARMPAGKLENDNTVNVLVYVSDRYGATSRFMRTIQVFMTPSGVPDQASASNLASSLMNETGAFTKAKKTGDVREMLQLCTILGDLLHVGAAADTGTGRRLQTEDAEQLVSTAISALTEEASSVPLDAALIAQFFSGIESTTAATGLLTGTSIDEALGLIELLLDESAGASISEAAAIDAATALQNILHALLVDWASMTSDPADWPSNGTIPVANRGIQARMTKVDTLVTRVGLARLPSVQCGESAIPTRPLPRDFVANSPSEYVNEKWLVRNRLFEMSSRKLCRSQVATIEVAHEDSSLPTNSILGSTVIPRSTASLVSAGGFVHSVTTVFYDNLKAPSSKPRAVSENATYPMANLTSPVVSTRLFNSNTGNAAPEPLATDVLTTVHRGSWSYGDPTTTTTLCVYFQASSNSWEECNSIVSSDIHSTTCSCPTATLVATVRSASECIVNTDCFTCLSNPKCGWCPGYGPRFSGQIPGAPGYCYEGNLQAEFFPGTCGDTPWGQRKAEAVLLEVDAWSYDSCPCESFGSCGDCMLNVDPYTGKNKRRCGYCPQSKRCLAAADSASCGDWYVDFVVGMQSGTKVGVTPQDGGQAWQETPELYEPAYPRNCPLNCSTSWGAANGYSIPGCDNGVCMDYVNCVCSPGYWSPDCSRMCPGSARNPCNGHGQCDAGASGSGRCFCNEGYGGADCADCDDGHWGAECLQECHGGGGNPCSGNGICSSGESGTGQCTCYRGYYGQDCSSFCPGARLVPQRICAGHGTCADGPLGDGRCSCRNGYFGTGCEGVCPRRSGPDPATGLPERDLSGQPNGPVCSGPSRGVCSDGSTGSGKCECRPSFFRSDCSGQCPGSTLSGNGTCNGRGVCSDGSAGTGLCRCLDGFRGDECELEPIRVRVALALDVSEEEWLLYGLKDMLYDGLAAALRVSGDVLVPITVLVGADEVTAFFEIRSKGFEFATDVLARLNGRAETDLGDFIRLPVILPLQSYTHIGALWPCGGALPYGIEATAHRGPPPPAPPLVDSSTGVRCFVASEGSEGSAGADCVVAAGFEGEGLPYVEPTLDCNARGVCNTTMGTCVCESGYAGTDCDTLIDRYSRPPTETVEEELASWLSTGWWLIVLALLVVGGSGCVNPLSLSLSLPLLPSLSLSLSLSLTLFLSPCL